jgi:hypothetical protein
MTDGIDRVQELKRRLALLDRSGSTETVLDAAFGIYNEAAGYIKALEEIQAGVKTLVEEIFTELLISDYTAPSGKASVRASYSRVSYDTKGLDGLAQENPMIGAVLAPYRKVTEVTGSLQIK